MAEEEPLFPELLFMLLTTALRLKNPLLLLLFSLGAMVTPLTGLGAVTAALEGLLPPLGELGSRVESSTSSGF